jgi:hypothetical protein
LRGRHQSFRGGGIGQHWSRRGNRAAEAAWNQWGAEIFLPPTPRMKQKKHLTNEKNAPNHGTLMPFIITSTHARALHREVKKIIFSEITSAQF